MSSVEGLQKDAKSARRAGIGNMLSVMLTSRARHRIRAGLSVQILVFVLLCLARSIAAIGDSVWQDGRQTVGTPLRGLTCFASNAFHGPDEVCDVPNEKGDAQISTYSHRSAKQQRGVSLFQANTHLSRLLENSAADVKAAGDKYAPSAHGDQDAPTRSIDPTETVSSGAANFGADVDRTENPAKSILEIGAGAPAREFVSSELQVADTSVASAIDVRELWHIAAVERAAMPQDSSVLGRRFHALLESSLRLTRESNLCRAVGKPLVFVAAATSTIVLLFFLMWIVFSEMRDSETGVAPDVARSVMLQTATEVRDGSKVVDRAQKFRIPGIRKSMSVSSAQLTNVSLPPDRLASFDDDHRFCPSLVVPDNHDFVCFVPLHKFGRGPSCFDIVDKSGEVVLCVVARKPSRDQDVHRLVLTTAEGSLLAQCCAASGSASAGQRSTAEFHVLSDNGEYYAKLLRAESSKDEFVLQTRVGERFRISGDFSSHSLDVDTVHGAKVAEVDISPVNFNAVGEFYRLHVASGQDVALVLCSLLCLDHLWTAQL